MQFFTAYSRKFSYRSTVFSKHRCKPGLLPPNSYIRLVNSGSSTSSDTAEALNFCISLVRQHDFGSYLAGLLLQKRYRDPYFAVMAFNIEISSIKEQSRRNNLTGRIRFQFWRDGITNIFSDEKKQSADILSLPVMKALNSYSAVLSPASRCFVKAIDAR